ncbi:hypothetical protein ACFQY4_43615 [Catellatospora bangladeshensis]|uniref:Uncharacterized protein n=1 Tax=Catellatospora bangladeshensis TaxID=310355 RepID=A0A8J3JCS1_9ACTN|nr:hypothetical protein [Catellatospora bangladeshensis]GIF82487.1 hypothetical protein Cba03nite_38360 [Catellatospora bangladeshensis]
MTTDQEAAHEQAEPVPVPAGGLSRRAKVIIGGIGGGLVAWFFFAWLGLKRNIVDAAGESIGSGILLLLLFSIAGATQRSRR